MSREIEIDRSEPVSVRARAVLERLGVRRRMNTGDAVQYLWGEVARLAAMVLDLAEEAETEESDK